MFVCLGVFYYWFFVVWSWVMVDGIFYIINSKGIEYYNNFINELLVNNI